jgi:hypothetical protein
VVDAEDGRSAVRVHVVGVVEVVTEHREVYVRADADDSPYSVRAGRRREFVTLLRVREDGVLVYLVREELCLQHGYLARLVTLACGRRTVQEDLAVVVDLTVRESRGVGDNCAKEEGGRYAMWEDETMTHRAYMQKNDVWRTGP